MKAKFGSIVVDGRGKLGGHVYSKNRGGSYVRTKVTPTNPQTSYQTAARAKLTTLSQNWRGLTANQRTAWNSAVIDFQRTDIFGDLKQPSGINLYVRLNTNILNAGGTVISTPPAASDAPDYVTFSAIADESASTLAITFTATPVPAATTYVIEATAQVSPGKSFLKNEFRVLATLAAAATSPSAQGTAYEARFGELVVGQKIGLRITAISTVTGLKSQPTVQQIIVVA